MGAKPAEQADAHCVSGYKAFWAAINCASQKGVFTVSDIYRETKTHRPPVRAYFRRLENAGYLKRVGVGADRAVIFEQVRKTRTAPRLREDGTHVIEAKASDQMWRAMQMMPAFTKHDLVTWASTDDKAIRLFAAADYIKHLKRAGYLQVMGASRPGTAAVYRLKAAMRTGPLAPVIKRIKVVYDRNLKKIMWAEDVNHV